MVKKNSTRLKKQTKALVEDLGVEISQQVLGRSKGMLIRNYSTQKGDMDRFICINGVAALESQASYPFVTSELAKINGFSFGPKSMKNVCMSEVDEIIMDLCLQFPRLILELRRVHVKARDNLNEINRLTSEISEFERTLIALKRAVCMQTG